MKKKAIIGTLSNGNVRLLVDMVSLPPHSFILYLHTHSRVSPKAKHADLPWDVVFSGELLGSYKP